MEKNSRTEAEDSRTEEISLAEDSNEPSMEEESSLAGGKRRLARSVDPYCVFRLRHRRLLAFLYKHGYLEAYNEINQNTSFIFDMKKLVRIVKEGPSLMEALNYICEFSPDGESRSLEAKVLVVFLYRLHILDLFVGGVHRALLPSPVILDEDRRLSRLFPCYFTLARHYVFNRRQDAMDMLDRQLVRSRAAKIAREMAYQAPEIRAALYLPRGRAKASNIFPLLASRRHVKVGRAERDELSVKKRRDELLQYYLDKKKSLPSRSEVTSHSGSLYVTKGQFLAVFEEALKAGKRPGINQQHPTNGVDSVPAMQTMSINSPCNHEDQQDENLPHKGVYSVPVMQTTSTNSPCNREDQEDENLPHKDVHSPKK